MPDVDYNSKQNKAMRATARSHEIFEALNVLNRSVNTIKTLMQNHDPAKIDNAQRRDCETFRARLTELGLWDRATAIASNNTATDKG